MIPGWHTKNTDGIMKAGAALTASPAHFYPPAPHTRRAALLFARFLLGPEVRGPLRKAEQEAIPEFRRFNIIENEVRNVV